MFDTLKNALRLSGEWIEGTCFDLRHNVRTRDYVLLRDAGIAGDALGDSEAYAPARPAEVRDALRCAIRAAGIGSLRSYTFVDLGSGKGRALLIAARFPFAECIGVEFSGRLHREAERNLAAMRGGAGVPIRLVHGNVRDFAFPETPLVIYLFNPFGHATARRVLSNLHWSLQEHPRHVVMVLLWPQVGDLVARWPGATRAGSTRRYDIYTWNQPPEPAGFPHGGK